MRRQADAWRTKIDLSQQECRILPSTHVMHLGWIIGRLVARARSPPGASSVKRPATVTFSPPAWAARPKQRRSGPKRRAPFRRSQFYRDPAERGSRHRRRRLWPWPRCLPLVPASAGGALRRGQGGRGEPEPLDLHGTGGERARGWLSRGWCLGLPSAHEAEARPRVRVPGPRCHHYFLGALAGLRRSRIASSSTKATGARERSRRHSGTPDEEETPRRG